jgi:hypothetical protein
MSRVGFESTISVFKRAKIFRALDITATCSVYYKERVNVMVTYCTDIREVTGSNHFLDFLIHIFMNIGQSDNIYA